MAACAFLTVSAPLFRASPTAFAFFSASAAVSCMPASLSARVSPLASTTSYLARCGSPSVTMSPTLSLNICPRGTGRPSTSVPFDDPMSVT